MPCKNKQKGLRKREIERQTETNGQILMHYPVLTVYNKGTQCKGLPGKKLTEENSKLFNHMLPFPCKSLKARDRLNQSRH